MNHLKLTPSYHCTDFLPIFLTWHTDVLIFPASWPKPKLFLSPFHPPILCSSHQLKCPIAISSVSVLTATPPPLRADATGVWALITPCLDHHNSLLALCTSNWKFSFQPSLSRVRTPTFLKQLLNHIIGLWTKPSPNCIFWASTIQCQPSFPHLPIQFSIIAESSTLFLKHMLNTIIFCALFVPHMDASDFYHVPPLHPAFKVLANSPEKSSLLLHEITLPPGTKSPYHSFSSLQALLCTVGDLLFMSVLKRSRFWRQSSLFRADVKPLSACPIPIRD